MQELTKEEISRINDILKDEYYYNFGLPISNGDDVEYRCFTKVSAIYSGLGVVKVYEYLKSIGINIHHNG